MFKDWFTWETKADKLESISFLILIVASVFTVVGVSVGSFVPGIPVLLAIAGAFLVIAGIIFYVISELFRIWENKGRNENKL